jgi:DNA ligase-1
MSSEPSLLESAVPFADVVAASTALAADPSRSGKVSLLAAFLARVPTAQLPAAVTILTGTVPAPLGVGPARLRAAWLESTEQTGLGFHDTAALTLFDVDAGLREIAGAGGAGSVRRKVALLRALLDRAAADEQDFLLRLCFGDLRQGALDGVMLEAIARAFGVDPELVRRAHMLSGDLAHTAFVAAASGSGGLAEIGLRLFRPLEPMLASASDTVEEPLARHGTTILEWKLDGARIQVHEAAGDVRVYTRSLRDVTAALPDVVAAVAALGRESIVLDGEAIALREDGRPYPFQVTMSRFGAGGPGDPTGTARPMPLTPFFFDVLHLDGETLIDRPQRERMRILHAVVDEANLLPALETASAADAEAFMAGALAAGHEGVVAKDPEAPYAAGRRGKAWIKVKTARTLDLVVLAVERGSGRRSGWWSNIHLGARDENGGFVMLGKTFKGMTDETLRWQTETFPALATREDGHVLHLRPAVVAEIAFNEIQASSRYPGGLALRFARLLRYRPDKTPDEADTITTVRELFESQSGRQPREPR